MKTFRWLFGTALVVGALSVGVISQGITGPAGQELVTLVNADGSIASIVGGTGGTSIADDSAFTVGISNLTPVGGIYRSTLDLVTDGDTGAFAMLQNRIMMSHLVNSDGTTATVGGGTQYTEADVDATITGTALMFEGAGNTLLAAPGTTAGGLLVDISDASLAVTNTGTFAVQADTELAAAAALADNTANPTIPGVGAFLMGFETTWDRITSTSGSLNVNITGGAGSGGTALADDADFTAGTTQFTPSGGFYQSAVTACTDGDTCAFGITAQRTLKATLFSSGGTELLSNTQGTHATTLGTITSVTGGVIMGNASSATPTDVGADGDAAAVWLTRTGAVNVADAGGSLTVDGTVTVTDGAGALNVICDSGCGSSPVYDHGGAITIADSNSALVGGRVSAAAPSTTGVIDDDFANFWVLATGAAVGQPSFAGVLAVAGSGVNGTGVQRFTLATDDELNDDADAIRVSTELFDDTVFTDDAAFTPATSKGLAVGFEADDTSPDSVDEGDFGVARMSLDRILYQRPGGASVHYRTSAAATEDEHEIKATAGVLYSVLITNTNAAARYIRCYNLTAANTTPGTSTVFWGAAIPGNTAGSGFTYSFPSGLTFDTALTCAWTTGAADSDVAEVAANEIKATYTYR